MIDIDNIARLSRRVKNLRIACQNDFGRLFRHKNLNRQKDIRITSIQRFTRLITGLNVSFLYISNTNQEEVLENIKIPIYEENIPIEQYLIVNEILLKLGFTSSLFFIIEGVLRVYLEYIDPISYSQNMGIKKVCEELLKKLAWKDSAYYNNAFNFFRLIRNTLHSNRIHNPANKSDKTPPPILYKGNYYIFEENKGIDFVTWDLLLDIAEDMKNLLFLIASDELINKSDNLIYDPLAI